MNKFLLALVFVGVAASIVMFFLGIWSEDIRWLATGWIPLALSFGAGIVLDLFRSDDS